MQLKLSVSLPIFFILSAALGEKYIDYRLVKSAQGRRVALAVSVNPKCDGSRKAICQNCKDIHICNTDQSSDYVWTCSTGETCFKGECTTEVVASCSPQAKLKFICSSEGIFPDPADCFKYHICVNTAQSVSGAQPDKFIDYPRSCTSDPLGAKHRFNPKTTYCDIVETAEVCSSEIPICTYILQRNPTSNPSVFYICLKYVQPGVIVEPSVLYPYQFICPNGKEYEPASYSCISKGGALLPPP